ncbi:C6 finger domain transcription factor nosA [Penicillium verhagenii]|nr:C6 finger domain transcription factor nosA [Penicillium verhagenii]
MSTSRNQSTPARARVTRTDSSSSNECIAPNPSSSTGQTSTAKSHKRSRSGCYTCRLRRKKCDEAHPTCGACINLNIKCYYKRPSWWGDIELRKKKKAAITLQIRTKKVIERSETRADLIRSRRLSSPGSGSPDYDFNRFADPHDMFSAHVPNPGLGTNPYVHYAPNCEIDVKTERQTYINNVPMRHETSTSTFSAFAPPQFPLDAPLPTFGNEEWFGDFGNEIGEFVPENEFDTFDPSMVPVNFNQSPMGNIPVTDEEDKALLDHFINKVLRQIFPVLEAHQRGYAHAQAILRTLETNKTYLHCCLSIAAIHRKTTEGSVSDRTDHDIMHHRFEAITQLCKALGEDINHQEILDATLAMIFFYCSVGPADDHLPDIPWFEHFQAATSLVNRLDLLNQPLELVNGFMAPSHSLSLTTWIDILGSTMIGKTPQFAHTYRSKHLSGTSSGLKELMGCDDRVMYLISEIACLDSLKREGKVDDMTLCSHVQAMAKQLEHTEPADPTLEEPYSIEMGVMLPEALTKIISHIFRVAARIYLCSIVPGFDRNQPTNENLIASVTYALQLIPAGPHGFDRSLVWPLLMTGVYATPGSHFRAVLEDRAVVLGDHADLGSFGRMYRLLREVWRLSDDPANMMGMYNEDFNSSLTSPISRLDRSGSHSPNGAGAILGGREIKRQQVHWRDIMVRNSWNYLLM